MGKTRKSMKIMLSALLIVMMFVLAGCQAVGGLDVNKTLLSTIDVRTYEGTSSLSIELIPDEKSLASMNPEDAVLMKLFSNTKINLYNTKVQSQNTMSADGDVSLADTKIPFQLSLTPEHMVMQVDGAVKPIVLDLKPFQGMFMQPGLGMAAELQGMQNQLADKSTDLVKAVGTFLVTNMPNPKNIDVSAVTESINGENVALTKLHSEIYGSEVLGLIRELLVNLSNDSAGLKQLLNQLYDIFIPIVQQMTSEFGEQGAGGTDLAQMLANKTLVVEYAFTMVQQELKKLVQEFDGMVADIKKGADTSGFNTILNDQSYIKANLYVDSSLMMRKADMEMMIAPQSGDLFGVKAIKVTQSRELWNVNQPVTAKAIDPGSDYSVLDEQTKPGKLLRMFDKSSAVYDLLYNQLHITRKHILLNMDNNKEYGYRPFIENKTAMVACSAFIGGELDSDVMWNGADRQVTIIDDLTEKQIVFTIGSNIAYVNGEPFELRTAPKIINGRSYVPLKFVIEQFGGAITWDGEKKLISIDRE